MLDEKKKTNKTSERRIRREDILLLVSIGVLVLEFRMFPLIWNRTETREGPTLVISWDGEEVSRLNLAADESWRAGAEGRMRYCLLMYTKFEKGGLYCAWDEEEPLPEHVPEGISYNILSVSGKGVTMEAADCPDQICVHHIPISGDGESIICLPHKLVVEIRGETEEDDLDGMVK